MFSPNKQDDREMLLEIAEMIEVLVKVGTKAGWDLAESFGESYLKLEDKIKTYDYSYEDEIANRIKQRDENYASLRDN